MFCKLFAALTVLSLLSDTGVAAHPKIQYSQRASLVSKQHRRGLKLKRQADAQTALVLDPSQIQPNLALTGQETPAVGQVESRTSTNNFINFCLTQDVPLTNGRQSAAGSCNPTPIGRIIATDKMPASKFTSPPNGGTIKANEAFTISMAVQNIVTGNKVNLKESFYAAPQQLQSGVVLGYSNFIVEKISAIDSTDVNDAAKFAFFKSVGEVAVGGVLSTTVNGGLPVGTYKLSSVNSAMNAQPVLVAVAQHGSLDDCIYFTVTPDGEPAEEPAVSVTLATASAASTSATASLVVVTGSASLTSDVVINTSEAKSSTAAPNIPTSASESKVASASSSTASSSSSATASSTLVSATASETTSKARR